MVRLYCSVAEGTPLTVELKSGQPIRGKVNWVREQHAGIEFEQPIDVIDILSASMDGPRPRLPRIETHGHATLREGAVTLRVRTRDISQGGAKIECETIFSPGSDVILTLPGLPPQAGIACWSEGGFTGIAFNRLLPLSELVAWLHDQRELQRNDAGK